jgi:hypothetical protein
VLSITQNRVIKLYVDELHSPDSEYIHLGAFTKQLQKATSSVVMSVCNLSVLMAHRDSQTTISAEISYNSFLINFTHSCKVCKSVHHRKTQINHQTGATIFQFIILTFIYGSTCFGHSLAHYQELNDCSGSLWLYLRIVVTVVLCSWSGRPAGRPDHEHSKAITTIRR